MSRLTRDAYAHLVEEDLAWLRSLPRSPERDHVVVQVVAASVDVYYPRASVDVYYPRPIRLFLDDVRLPPADGRGPWTVVRTLAEACAVLSGSDVEEASLDHDLGQCAACADGERDTCSHAATGYDLVKWMAETGHWPRTKPVVHSANPVGAAAMRQMIDRHWAPPKET